MKKINLLVISLVSAAALSFSSCSSNDDLSAGGNGSESKVDGFYMTLTVQTPKSNGTRTEVPSDTNKQKDATAQESDVTSGTFFLVDQDGTLAYSKEMSQAEWESSTIPTQGQIGKTTLSIAVNNVTAGTKYKVYFLANTTSKSPWKDDVYSVPTTITERESKFSGAYSIDQKFAMFNENDKTNKADQYEVTFTEENKKAENPAKVKVGETEPPIKIERVTARIDEPTSNATTINSEKPSNFSNLSEAEKKKIEDALDKVQRVALTRYAISNLSNTTYVMQHWNEAFTALSIPNTTNYIQPTSEFGGTTNALNLDYFKAVTENKTGKDYVFENNSTTDKTTMYFEYKVTLDDSKFSDDTPDCSDGTFYRYDNKVYRSLDAIAKAYEKQTNPFGGTKTADLVKEKLKISDGKIGATEDELKSFRETYNIEVYRAGLCYYKNVITDSNMGDTTMILRNTIYQLTVNNVYNIGADVPNGNPETVEAMYYLNVSVSVNPWVLSTQSVDLK